MSWLGESLKQFLSREAGQKRTKRLNEGISEALRYYLGPTGVPERMEAAAMLNPVQDMYEAGANMKAGDYGSAAVNTASALMPTIGAKLAGGGAVDDVANVISDTLTSVGTKATGAMDAGRGFAADEFGGVGPKGIRAYHGSPHDFDRFSMDKIGTGEGAQAYGHGLYFAESEGVARSYRDALRSQPGVEAGPYVSRHQYRGSLLNKIRENNPEFAESEDLGRKVDNLSRSLWAHAEKQGENPIVTVKNWLDSQEKFSRSLMQPPYNNAGDDLAIIQAMREMPEPRFVDDPGRMYEVNINANPDDFLDWDAPLSEQSAKVQNSIEEVLYYLPSHEREAARRALTGTETAYDRDWNITRGANLVKQAPFGIEKELNKTGVPGIKYLDQGSRGAGDGTRNYVVFDENLIEIVRKYGIAGAAALLGVSASDVQAAMGQQE